jgi:hypothetical protein
LAKAEAGTRARARMMEVAKENIVRARASAVSGLEIRRMSSENRLAYLKGKNPRTDRRGERTERDGFLLNIEDTLIRTRWMSRRRNGSGIYPQSLTGGRGHG